MVTVDYLIKELDKYLAKPRPATERIITSDRFTDWLQDRLVQDVQVLLNGVVCREGEMQDRLQHIRYQIEQEFIKVATIHVLPYPTGTDEELRELITGLLNHFSSGLRPESVIQKINSTNRDAGDYTSYLIITLINRPIIV